MIFSRSMNRFEFYGRAKKPEGLDLGLDLYSEGLYDPAEFRTLHLHIPLDNDISPALFYLQELALMAEYTPKERLACALGGGSVDRMPEASDDAERVHTAVGFDAVRVPFDITAEARFFGCGIKAGTQEQKPSVVSHVVRTTEDIEKLKGYDLNHGRVGSVCDAIKILADRYGNELPVIGSMIGPFSLAQHLNGDDWFMAIFTDEVFSLALMEFTTDFNVAYAQKMVENGADTMVIIDPVASTQVIGAELYERFVVPYHKRICDAMRELNVTTVLHTCGGTTRSLALMELSGVDGISVDRNVDVATAVASVKKATIIGNLDPVNMPWNQTHEVIREGSQKILDEGVGLLAPGCGIISKTPT